MTAAAPVSPATWVGHLGGEDLLQARPRRWRGVGVGMWSFSELPDRLTLPGLDMHYISFTVRGPLHVEDNVGLIEHCKKAYKANGLGEDFVDQFIR